MENLNAEQIKKALECCTRGRKSKEDRPCLNCLYNECNLVGGTSERQRTGTCQGWLMKDALTLINWQEQKIFELENRLKECENGYKGTNFLDRCKLHDAEEKVRKLTEDNERLHASCTELTRKCASLEVDVAKEFTCVFSTPHKVSECPINDEIAKAKADTVRKMQDKVRKKIKKTEWLNGRAVHLEIDQIAKEMLEDKQCT